MIGAEGKTFQLYFNRLVTMINVSWTDPRRTTCQSHGQSKEKKNRDLHIDTLHLLFKEQIPKMK
jgi:hypothetical protein